MERLGPSLAMASAGFMRQLMNTIANKPAFRLLPSFHVSLLRKRSRLGHGGPRAKHTPASLRHARNRAARFLRTHPDATYRETPGHIREKAQQL